MLPAADDDTVLAASSRCSADDGSDRVRALALYRESGNRLGQAAALNRLGELSSRTSATGQAREYRAQALAIARDLNAPLEARPRRAADPGKSPEPQASIHHPRAPADGAHQRIPSAAYARHTPGSDRLACSAWHRRSATGPSAPSRSARLCALLQTRADYAARQGLPTSVSRSPTIYLRRPCRSFCCMRADHPFRTRNTRHRTVRVRIRAATWPPVADARACLRPGCMWLIHIHGGRPVRYNRGVRGGPVGLGPCDLTAEHHDLVTQRHDLRVLKGLAAAQHDQPAERPDHDQVQETHRYDRDLARNYQPARPHVTGPAPDSGAV